MYMFDNIHQIFFFLLFRAFKSSLQGQPIYKEEKDPFSLKSLLKKWPISKEEKWSQDLY